MIFNDLDTIVLSEPAERAIGDRILSALQPPAKHPFDISRMVRYLAGASSMAETHRIEQQLVSDASLRAEQRRIFAELEELQRISWNEVEALSQEGSLVANAWRTLIAERAEAASRLHRSTDRPFWLPLKQGTESAHHELQAAWMSFTAFLEQVRLHVRASHLRPAPMRGPEDGAAIQLVNAPVPLTAMLHSGVNADGTINVSLELNDELGQPYLAGTGKRIALQMEMEGDFWPLGVSVMENSRVHWLIPPLNAVLSQFPEGLPPGVLRAIFDPADDSALPSARCLFAEVQDAAGTVLEDPPVKLFIGSLPYVEQETFHVAISLAEAVRAVYSDYSVVLDAGIAAGQWQRLGKWPVDDWVQTERHLSVPCPGLPDVATYRGPLRLLLQSGT